MKVNIPHCPKITKLLVEHGKKREDPYFWIREKENPNVKAYVESENRYFKETLKPIENLTEQCFQQMKALLEKEARVVPYQKGSFWYGSRIPEGAQYSIYFRTKDPLDQSHEEILLDLNALSAHYSYLELHGLSISPDESKIAYSLDTDGSEKDTIFIKDLKSGLVDKIKIAEKRAHGEAVWSADGHALFFAEQNEQDRPDRIIRYDFSTNAESQVFLEKDPRFFVSIRRSKDESFIFIESESKESSETWFWDTAGSHTSMRLLAPRRENHLYSLECQSGLFLILSNSFERNYRLISTSTTNFGEENWQEIFRGNERIDIRSLEVFESGLAVLYGDLGTLKIGVYQRKDDKTYQKIQDLNFAEEVYDVSFLNNEEYASKRIRVYYSSPKTPPQTIEFDFLDGTKRLLHQRQRKSL